MLLCMVNKTTHCDWKRLNHDLQGCGRNLLRSTFSLLSSVWKSESTLIRSTSCVCVYYLCVLCLYLCSPINFWIRNLYETWYVHHGTWPHLRGLIHKSSSSVIPTLQPLKLQRQYLIAWTPAPVFMKLGIYVVPHKMISPAHAISLFDLQYQNYSISNCCGNNCIVTYMPEPIATELGTFIMTANSISTT
jgi:hypothetical protein